MLVLLCSCLYAEDGLAMEGPDFRNMPEEELLPLLPRLQVCPVAVVVVLGWWMA